MIVCSITSYISPTSSKINLEIVKIPVDLGSPGCETTAPGREMSLLESWGSIFQLEDSRTTVPWAVALNI